MQLFLFKASQLFSNQELSASHMLKPDVNITVCKFAVHCSEQSNHISGEDIVQGTEAGEFPAQLPAKIVINPFFRDWTKVLHYVEN